MAHDEITVLVALREHATVTPRVFSVSQGARTTEMEGGPGHRRAWQALAQRRGHRELRTGREIWSQKRCTSYRG